MWFFNVMESAIARQPGILFFVLHGISGHDDIGIMFVRPARRGAGYGSGFRNMQRELAPWLDMQTRLLLGVAVRSFGTSARLRTLAKDRSRNVNRRVYVFKNPPNQRLRLPTPDWLL